MNWNGVTCLYDECKRGALIVSDRGKHGKSDVLLGQYHSRNPIRYDYHMGKTPYDIVPTAYAGLYLISPRLLKFIEYERLTGWKPFPVEAYGKDGARLEGYAGFAVTGRCGPIDKSRCRKVYFPPPVPHGKGRISNVGLYCDPGTWDGSDFFVPEGTFFRLVTERAKNAILSQKFTNIKFKSVLDIEFPILSTDIEKSS